MNWLLKLIFKAIGEMISAVVKKFSNIFNNVYEEMYEIFKDLKLDSIADYTAIIGITLLTLFTLKQLLDVYVFEVDGDSEEDPLSILTRASIAIATIMAGNTIVDFMIKGASQFTKELLSSLTYLDSTYEFSKEFDTAIGEMLGQATAAMFVILLLFFAILIAYVILFFKAAKRAAELVWFQIMLPIMACDMITKSKERWNSFKTELIICIFGYSLQILSFNIFLMLFSKIGTDFDMKYIIGSFTWLWLVLSSPKWLQKFSYSSGIGGGAKGAMRTAGSMLPNLIRK